MKKNLKYILTFIIVSSFLTLHISAENEKEETPNKIISVVYDDSGSMFYQGSTLWAEANYGLQMLCSSLDSNNSLFITYTSQPYLSNRITGFPQNRKTVVDSIRGHREIANSSPLSAVDTAVNRLKNRSSDSPDTEYWLVIMSDGAFNTFDRVPISTEEFEEKINGVGSKAMPNESKLNIVYMGIGNEAVSLKNSENIHSYHGDISQVNEIMMQILSIVNSSYLFDENYIHWVDERTIEFITPLPLMDLNVLNQYTNTEIMSIYHVDKKMNIPIKFNVPLKYPELDDYNTNKNLFGVSTQIGFEDQLLPAGKYQIMFTSDFQKENIKIYGKLGVAINIDLFDQQINNKIDKLSTKERQVIHGNASVLRLDTNEPVDLSVLNNSISYSMDYSVNNHVIKHEISNDFQLSDLTLTRDISRIVANIKIGNNFTLNKSLVFQPRADNQYTIETNHESLVVNKDTMNLANPLILTIYRNGVQITNPNETREILLDFTWEKNDSMLWMDVTYQEAGTIRCVPNYGIKELRKSLSQWLSTWRISEGINHLEISLKASSNNKKVTTTIPINFVNGNVGSKILNLVLPIILISIFLGYIFKSRFKHGTEIRYINIIIDENECNSYFHSWERKALAESYFYPSSWRSLIPFIPNAIKINQVTFYASSSHGKRDVLIKANHQPNQWLKLNHSKNISTHNSLSIELINEQIEPLPKGKIKLKYEQGIIVPIKDNKYILYKLTLNAKKHNSRIKERRNSNDAASK